MVRHLHRPATWDQLNEHVLVRVIDRVYQVLGVKLTQRKLAQAVPFVGVAINAALSANITTSLYERAEHVYRLRFLAEKYGLDPETWMAGVSSVKDHPQDQGELPDVAEILGQERESSE